jgi:steroid 5-alpha reductase family enzyme
MNPHLGINSRFNKNSSLLICGIVYLITFIGSYLCLALFEELGQIYSVLIIDIIATVFIFLVGIVFRNASLYDAYWSVAPVPIALYWWSLSGFDMEDGRKILAFLALLLWAVRLTLNWARGWIGLTHEDWRYGMLRQKTGIFYPFVNLAGIHLFPTLMVFLGCMPLYFILSTENEIPLGWMDYLGFSVSIIGILMELIADEQLRTFKKKNADNPLSFIDSGIWYFSRHPNYFGEILFWTGLFFMAISADSSIYWTAAGFMAMYAMFRFISIPMMDERMIKKRPKYAELMNKVSQLVPWFRLR